MEKRDFTLAFLKDHKNIGAVRPSSRFLVRKMIQFVDFSKAKVIVELGPGTGVVTESLVKNMSSDCHLVVFELNDQFYNHLEKKYSNPNIHLIHDSAENIEQHLKELNLQKPDYIISSLPLANFSDELREKIIVTSNSSLTDDGKFIQFQYSLNSKKQLTQVFSSVETTFTMWNIPPAFVFYCSKK